MIYFLVNNNFHLIDAEKHFDGIKNHEIGLIKIPHQLTIAPSKKYNVEIEYPRLINKLKDHFYFLRIFRLHRKIKKELKNIQETDVLLFYTEYEYLTHYIVKIFKQKKAKVLLIEEGFPTYLAFASETNSSIGLKKKILDKYLKYILGYRNSKIVSANGFIYTQLEDNQIDLLLLYTNLNIKRNVLTDQLTTDKIEFKNLKENTALFLNEWIYDHYISMDQYLFIIDDIFLNLSENFDEIYFKFHPREKDEKKKQILTVLEKYPKTKIIVDNSPVELMIEKIGAKFIISFAAQTVLYLSNSNCIALYIMQLYPELMKDAEITKIKSIIDEMDYVFMSDWSEIKNGQVGFKEKTYLSNTLSHFLS
jgi:TusA-related sulfurtransferase